MLCGLVLLFLIEGGALEQRIKIDLVRVEVRPVNAGELRLAAHGQAVPSTMMGSREIMVFIP